MKLRKGTVFLFACLALGLSLGAQNVSVQVQEARLSIPFGDVNGRLITVGEYLVFVDEDQPNNSFAIPRQYVRSINAQEDRVTVDLSQAVRDRSGERSHFIFQLRDRAEAMALTAWAGAGRASNMTGSSGNMTNRSGSTGTTETTGTTGMSSTGGNNGILATYPVTHEHMLGSCHGRLIVRQDLLAYESIDKLEDSRQWALRDVRELKLDNPYELTVNPFRGDGYEFTFDGKGMDTGIYQQLVERVTDSRSAE